MKVVTVSKSFIVNGKVQTNEFEMKTIGDLNVLFMNAIKDAQLYARLRGGEIVYKQEKTSLYINYTGVANSKLIDKQYILKP
jgi:hypothetical protein